MLHHTNCRGVCAMPTVSGEPVLLLLCWQFRIEVQERLLSTKAQRCAKHGGVNHVLWFDEPCTYLWATRDSVKSRPGVTNHQMLENLRRNCRYRRALSVLGSCIHWIQLSRFFGYVTLKIVQFNTWNHMLRIKAGEALCMVILASIPFRSLQTFFVSIKEKKDHKIRKFFKVL